MQSLVTLKADAMTNMSLIGEWMGSELVALMPDIFYMAVAGSCTSARLVGAWFSMLDCGRIACSRDEMGMRPRI